MTEVLGKSAGSRERRAPRAHVGSPAIDERGSPARAEFRVVSRPTRHQISCEPTGVLGQYGIDPTEAHGVRVYPLNAQVGADETGRRDDIIVEKQAELA